MSYPNPHLTSAALGQDLPEALDSNPIPSPRTAVGKQAKQLHDSAQEATARLRSVDEIRSEAARALAEAREALQAEIIRGGREGLDADRESELARELAGAEHLADGQSHALRYRAAIQAQRESVRTWLAFCWDHYTELLDELRPEAERASEDLTKALEKVRPAQDAYNEIAGRVYGLNRILAHGPDAADWARFMALRPTPQPPLPSDEAIEHVRNLNRPDKVTSEAVEVGEIV
jgi:hypothetical protein